MNTRSGKLDYECPNCNGKNKIILMGEQNGIFEKMCKTCNSKLEVTLKDNEINILVNDVKNKIKKVIPNIKIPADYVKYDGEKNIFQNRTVKNNTIKIITALILIASLSGFVTGGLLMDFFSDDYIDYEEIQIEIIVKNNTNDLSEATIIIDSNEINQTYLGNGTYNILAKPGKHLIKIIVDSHKNASMKIFIPPQDDNLSLIEIDQGIDGVNRFTFIMEKGVGNIDLEDTVYVKVESWCPNLIFLFSFIGLWGSWVTYTLQSYKNAQIGAFFSILATGFLIIGPILGIIALVMLYRNKNLFTASFKN
jgi:hypothetical protein|tara:strand:- start:2161 stop:3084 length:924 start_codon:yes stop_codon:yes gene_type:complete